MSQKNSLEDIVDETKIGKKECEHCGTNYSESEKYKIIQEQPYEGQCYHKYELKNVWLCEKCKKFNIKY